MKDSVKFALICFGLLILLFITDSIGFWSLIGLVFLVAIISGVWAGKEKEKERNLNKQKLDEQLNLLEGFVVTKKLVSPWGLIAIDHNSQQVAIRETSGEIRKFPYSAILSCEVIEDGETTYKKSSTIGRAIVGGVIAGGAGAVIGGLSGGEKEDKEIKYLDFKLVIKDTNNPSFRIRFFDAWEETNRTKESVKISDSVYGPKFEKSANQLKEWKDTIEVILDGINNRKDSTTISGNQPLADEISKLHELKEKGALTEDEFQEQKKRILK